MTLRNLKAAMVAAACIAALAAPASADPVVCEWQDPCDLGPNNCLFDFCFCEGSWGYEGNWSCTGDYSGYPSQTSHEAEITQTTRDDLCSEQTSDETWLEISLADVTVGGVLIQADTGGDLRLSFTGSATLTVEGNVGFEINATNGPVVVHVEDGAKVEAVAP